MFTFVVSRRFRRWSTARSGGRGVERRLACGSCVPDAAEQVVSNPVGYVRRVPEWIGRPLVEETLDQIGRARRLERAGVDQALHEGE